MTSEWDIEHLREHLQFAVDLEFWTIPFYMSAMYSIADPSDDAFQLIQSVAYQEMLHVQLAANVANAYGVDVKFAAPEYRECHIPHLDFDLDEPNPTERFHPWNSTIGPLDVERINAMCLIEYPEWPEPQGEPPPKEDATEYGSIGEFYRAVLYGAAELQGHIVGGRNQVDYFSRFYRGFGSMKVDESGPDGFPQVEKLIHAIVEQGEGQSSRHTEIPTDFRNTADDPEAVLDHFDKFISIRDGGGLPAVLAATAEPRNEAQHRARRILLETFTEFRATLEKLFGGAPADDFPVLMAKVGGGIRNCWQQGVVPAFSEMPAPPPPRPPPPPAPPPAAEEPPAWQAMLDKTVARGRELWRRVRGDRA